MKIYADGGCKPNPGKMAIAVVDEDGNVLQSQLLGDGTNNIAEYLAVEMALTIAKGKGLRRPNKLSKCPCAKAEAFKKVYEHYMEILFDFYMEW